LDLLKELLVVFPRSPACVDVATNRAAINMAVCSTVENDNTGLRFLYIRT